jgi:hypothetical protein
VEFLLTHAFATRGLNMFDWTCTSHSQISHPPNPSLFSFVLGPTFSIPLRNSLTLANFLPRFKKKERMTKEEETKELRESNELTQLAEKNMVVELEKLLATGYNINGYNKVISVKYVHEHTSPSCFAKPK